jgi:hypothetical protein
VVKPVAAISNSQPFTRYRSASNIRSPECPRKAIASTGASSPARKPSLFGASFGKENSLAGVTANPYPEVNNGPSHLVDALFEMTRWPSRLESIRISSLSL